MTSRSPFFIALLLIAVLSFSVGCGSGDEPVDPPDNQEQEEATNACGGESSLVLDGQATSPGSSCGVCGDGNVVCDGEDALHCMGASPENACGGCQPLHAVEGDSCGPCDHGVFQCDGEGGLECVGASETNACGGCSVLAAHPGDDCGDAEVGQYACTGPDDVRCVVGDENVCGGDEELDAIPGTGCGACDQGVVACDGLEQTRCIDGDRGVNPCGGCEDLPGIVGNQCGACSGEFVCHEDDPNGLVCQGGATNVCGGCEELDAFPGQPCDGGGVHYCVGPNELDCTEPGTGTAINACGGNLELSHRPGESCGVCGDGEYFCASPNALGCRDAGELNACGGCERLDGGPLMSSCGTCGQGVLICSSPNHTICINDPVNACGGCNLLPAQPDTPCGIDGTVICDGPDQIYCEGNRDPAQQWEIYSPDDPSWPTIESIWGSAPDDLWMVGAQDFVARYDGSEWDDYPAYGEEMAPTYSAVWGDSEGVIWVGSTYGDIMYYDDDQWNFEVAQISFLPILGFAEFGGFSDVQGQTVLAWNEEVVLAELGPGDWMDIHFVDPDEMPIRDLWVRNDNEAWAVGDGGVLHRLAGEEWISVEMPEADGLYAIWGTDGEAWAMGEHALFYDGDEWSLATEIDFDGIVTAIDGTAADNIWAVGTNGLIAHYDGQAWTEAYERPLNANHRDVFVFENGEAWITGTQGLLYRQAD